MSQTVAFVLPLPVALALVLLLLVLVALSVVALSLRQPLPVRHPEGTGEGGDEEFFRLGRLQIDGIGELSAPQRRVR
ncbi:hypothetical protein [Telluria aromaticivorans]|uniref:Uncharacterized protein n=1 Tax=Telluria aromaticivorans TaxID=2725995 RepID=A0A7Y2JYV1_9BURK|nr:hypothetical protein [Telluria aromaticivorans]NNG23436.1 hypothetical protein [Telluria aromaticivorans]